jgi:hypothetical protein
MNIIIRHQTYCICCGSKIKRIRLNSERNDDIELECERCNIYTIITPDNEKSSRATVQIPLINLSLSFWPRMNEDSEPIFTCPFCKHNLIRYSSKDNPNYNIYSCEGVGCKREFEIDYMGDDISNA